MRGRWGVLAEPQFRTFWIGRAASAVGDSLMPVTLVFAILSVGGDASDIGLVLGVSVATRVVLLVFGGAIADRLPRRSVLIGCDVSLAVIQVIVGILLLTGHSGVNLLLAASVLYGAASALSKPALTGLTTQVVSKEKLQQANALMSLSRSISQILGPALGGLIAALGTPWLAYHIDALTFVVSAITILMVRVPPAARKNGTTFLRDIATGWTELTARPWYWIGLCCHGVWNVGSCVFLVLGPVIISGEAGGPAMWGLVASSTAVGSLVGGLVVLRWRPRRPLVVGHLALLLTALQLAALLDPSPVGVIMAASLLGASGVAFVNQIWTTAMQQLIPEELISRISSYDWLVSFTAAPLGYALAGPLADTAGNTATLGAAIFLVTAPVLALILVPGIRAVRQSPDGTMDLGLPADGSSAMEAVTPSGAAR